MAKQAKQAVGNGTVAARVKELAGELCQLLYGETGAPKWGTKFTEVEDAGVAVGDAVARAVIEQALAGQASTTAAQPDACGHCGQRLGQAREEPHLIHTRRGDVGWNEAAGYCDKCRKSFFPSVEATRGGARQPL